MQHIVLEPFSVYNSNNNNPLLVTKQKLPKYKLDQNPTYQMSTVNKEKIQHLISSATALIIKLLESPCIKLPNPTTIMLDGMATGVLLKDLLQHVKRKDAAIPDIYFTLLDAISIPPDLIINCHAKAKERRDWIPFKIWTTKVPQILHARVYCLWPGAQFGKWS